MELRVGRVIETYSQTGRVKVTYEDTDTSSLELPMLTMNNECSLPNVGSIGSYITPISEIFTIS